MNEVEKQCAIKRQFGFRLFPLEAYWNNNIQYLQGLPSYFYASDANDKSCFDRSFRQQTTRCGCHTD